MSDWSEINTEQITVDDNGNAVLPTYFDYLNIYYKDKYNDWKKQYRRLRDRNGRNLDEMLSEVLVLPALSDPTMKDSDGDGINEILITMHGEGRVSVRYCATRFTRVPMWYARLIRRRSVPTHITSSP